MSLRGLLLTTAAALVIAIAMLSLVMSATAADTGARLQGTWTMKGKITRADNVRGERKGQRVTRQWSFSSTCASGPCKTAKVKRQRTHGQTDTTVLNRVRPDYYSGNGRFYVRLRCAGKVYPRGGLATMSISVRITRSATVQGKQFATRVSATYNNKKRVNRTPCAGGIGRDAATYTGTLKSPVPTPPTADFTSSRPDPVITRVAFSDSSAKGASGARVVKWRWDFGDPVSGDSNTSTARNPSHDYTAPGTYTVKLTVTDANGLTSTVEHEVSV
ncbi:MAG: trimeric autotransporter adhesin [Thermoleophilaceae bacterium]|nr:trimeric autotransporter adhesin [Thermoleophilaceae bacterium]